MGDMADHYAEEEMVAFYSQLAEEDISRELRDRVARYSVDENEIREMLFKTSVKDLCRLADITLIENYPADKYDSFEMNKIIDIAAWGLTKKFLTEKQKWNLASFILFYSKGGD